MTTEEIVERGMSAPLYAGVLPDATHRGEAKNGSCGDVVHFDFKIIDGRIMSARHTCKACVLTTATADFFCEAAEGQTPEFVSTLNPYDVIGIPIGPNRDDCILVVWEAICVSLYL